MILDTDSDVKKLSHGEGPRRCGHRRIWLRDRIHCFSYASYCYEDSYGGSSPHTVYSFMLSSQDRYLRTGMGWTCDPSSKEPCHKNFIRQERNRSQICPSPPAPPLPPNPGAVPTPMLPTTTRCCWLCRPSTRRFVNCSPRSKPRNGGSGGPKSAETWWTPWTSPSPRRISRSKWSSGAWGRWSSVTRRGRWTLARIRWSTRCGARFWWARRRRGKNWRGCWSSGGCCWGNRRYMARALAMLVGAVLVGAVAGG